MAVLALVARGRESFTVPFLKETIQYYKSGRVLHVVRAFLRCDTHISGFSIFFESTLSNCKNLSDALFRPIVMGPLQEHEFTSLSRDQAQLDGSTYRRAFWSTCVHEVSGLGELRVEFDGCADGGSCHEGDLALMLSIESQRRPRPRLKAWFLGSMLFRTHLLYAPSTLGVGQRSFQDQRSVTKLGIEARAVVVQRYELWIAAQGRIESTTGSPTPAKEQRIFDKKGREPEIHLGLPPISRGWCTKYLSIKNSCFHNVEVLCDFRQDAKAVALSWIVSLVSVALAVYSLARQ